MRLSVIFHIVDSLQFSVFCIWIRCNSMHPLCDALPVPLVPVCVIMAPLDDQLYAIIAWCHCCITHPRSWFRLHVVPWSLIGIRIYSSSLQTLAVPQEFKTSFSISIWKDLDNSVFHGVWLAGFKCRVNALFVGMSCCPIFVQCFLFFFLPTVGWLCVFGSSNWEGESIQEFRSQI